MATADVSKTFGALLVGGAVALVGSGVVGIQTFMYYKLYPADLPRNKLLVTAVWCLDVIHSSFICASLWHYLIAWYGNPAAEDLIPWTIAATIAVTALLTLLVHCFFAYRIFLLSDRNWFITIPLLCVVVLRLGAATVTTAEMVHLKTFTAFKAQFRWVFTLGLALSSFIDVFITGALFYYLKKSRRKSVTMSLNWVIDTMLLYAFENGALTAASTILSMICWLAMPRNFVFMGLHFFISKLYANSLLVTLNTRETLRRGRSIGSEEERYMEDTSGILGINDRQLGRRNDHGAVSGTSNRSKVRTINSTSGDCMQINVLRTVNVDVDEGYDLGTRSDTKRTLIYYVEADDPTG